MPKKRRSAGFAGLRAGLAQVPQIPPTKPMKAPPDRALLARFIARLSQLAAGAPWRRFVLEINPVKWSDEQVTAVDGLLIVEEP